MRYLDEFRDRALSKKIVDRIFKITPKDKKITLMEVCGTHTMAFFRYGLKELLPENIKLLSGPGCPVCVSPQSYIDRAISFAKEQDVIITTFGDMLRVPGTNSSLEKERSYGADVRVIYSSLDGLKIARDNPDKKIVFLGIGFETTAPTVAVVILVAAKERLENYFVLSGHKLIPPAMEVLVNDGEIRINGFLCPGHVSTIIGSRPYELIAKDYRLPCCIAGFEPLDILEGIHILIKQIVEGESKVEIQYRRVVKKEGNLKAQDLMSKVFEIYDSEWRGLGEIAKSGLRIKKEFSQFDAEVYFNLPTSNSQLLTKIKGCICGDILRGKKSPLECQYFAKDCTPEEPLGPCMVSSEGTCAAYYKYTR